MESTDETVRSNASFQARRIYVFINIALLYALVYFQRSCPTVVGEDMAKTYGVEKGELSVFSSIFFYPYGIIQPFAGLLSDVLEPAFLIGGAQTLAAIGAIICGASKSVAVGCVGRFLVGLGCGPTYVPSCRCLTNWFPLRYLPVATGVLVAIGGVGGIVASGPLAAISESVGWHWAFYGVGILGLLFSVLDIVFVRGNPVTLHYAPVNKELSNENSVSTFKDKMITLWENFKKVISKGDFWIVVVYCVCCNGPWFDISGMWASVFLQDVLHYSKQEAADCVISLSIGLIIGSMLFPFISSWLKTRKWVCFGTTIATSIVYFIIYGLMDKLSYGVVYFLFIIIGMTTNCMTSVAYPFVREYYHPAVAGTAVGCANIFTFLSSAVYQEISGSIIKSEGSYKDSNGNTIYTVKGYRDGLWLFCAISSIVAAIAIAFAHDSKFDEGTSDAKEGVDEKSDEAPPEAPEQTGEDLHEL